MGSPSKRSLQAAALAREGPSTDIYASSSGESPGEHLLKLASELKERIDVLRILDGTAPQWPGITNCLELLYAVAAEASNGLQQAYQAAQQSSSQLQAVNAQLQAESGRADEAEDALAASNSENSRLSAELEQVQGRLGRVQSELTDERAEKERKVWGTTVHRDILLCPSCSIHSHHDGVHLSVIQASFSLARCQQSLCVMN